MVLFKFVLIKRKKVNQEFNFPHGASSASSFTSTSMSRKPTGKTTLNDFSAAPLNRGFISPTDSMHNTMYHNTSSPGQSGQTQHSIPSNEPHTLSYSPPDPVQYYTPPVTPNTVPQYPYMYDPNQDQTQNFEVGTPPVNHSYLLPQKNLQVVNRDSRYEYMS